MFAMVLLKLEFGPMAKFEETLAVYEDVVEERESTKGTVFDLVFPIAILIIFCTIGMIYSGGFFSEGDTQWNFIDAFANSDASVGLVLGSLAAIVITLIVYLARRVLSFEDAMACLPDGFKAMVPAILILTLAWTLKGMTDSLGAKDFVAGVVQGSAAGLQNLLPAIIFIIASLLAFATGTSWGTFGILIPICIAVFPEGALRIISISACMAGAVCGDHCSPISDTTIMASAGAMCNHVNHVSTQLPYAMSVAGISFLTYIVAGFVQNVIISFIVGLVFLAAFIVYVKKKYAK